MPVTKDVPTTSYKQTSGNKLPAATASSTVAHRFGQAGNTAEKSSVDYKVGDTVMHKTFGRGTVLSLKPMGGDTLVEIAFDKTGTKKMMANFSRLERC